jgi:hypothetical protein
MKLNRKSPLFVAAIPLPGVAFAANSIWATVNFDRATVDDGIAGAGNFTLGCLDRVKSFAALGGSCPTAVSGASRQKPISSNHIEYLLLI